MENRSHALMTGFFTITLLIAAVLFGMWFNRDRTERVPYQIATTQAVPGLNPQGPVRYRGLEVGRVGGIVFDPRQTGQILVNLNINADAPITQTTFATLAYQGVTGIAYIQLDDDQVGSPRLATHADNPSRIPLRTGLFDQIEKRGKEILAQTQEVSARLNALLSPANQQIIVGAFADVSATAQRYRDLSDQLQPGVARLPAIADQAQATLNAYHALALDATRLSKSLQAPGGAIERASLTIEQVGRSVAAVSSGVELEALPHVVALSDDTRASMRALKSTLNKINERPQSILFGAPGIPPGPGEAGFTAPAQ